MTGEMADQWAGPSPLTTLNLTNCGLSGVLPATLPPLLKSLDLSQNNLSGGYTHTSLMVAGDRHAVMHVHA